MGAVSNFDIGTKEPERLYILKLAIALPKADLKSMGIVSGQIIEAEVNGSTQQVYADAANISEQGLDLSQRLKL